MGNDAKFLLIVMAALVVAAAVCYFAERIAISNHLHHQRRVGNVDILRRQDSDLVIPSPGHNVSHVTKEQVKALMSAWK